MADGSDIQLLFGVKGEGTLSDGSSGKLIQDQLSEIIEKINKKELLKVKVGLDTRASAKKSWNNQLQDTLDKISASGKLSVQISTLKLSAGAVSNFKKQLSAIVSTLGLSTGTEITISANGVGEIKNELKKTGDAASDAAQKIAEFKVQMEALSGQKNSVKKSLDELAKTATTDEEWTKIAAITTQYEQWAVKIEQVRASKVAASGETRAAIEAEGAAIAANIEQLNQQRNASKQAGQAAADAARTQQAAQEAAAARESEELKLTKSKNDMLRRAQSLLSQVTQAQKNWTAAQNGVSIDSYARLADISGDLNSLIARFNAGAISVEEFNKEFSALNGTFVNVSGCIRAAGENTKTLSERMGGLASKFTSWLTVSQVIMHAIGVIRKMVKTTIELDSALTQVSIVTGKTGAALEKFALDAAAVAKTIGASVSDIVKSTETFARLGFTLEDSLSLANVTGQYANVAATSLDEATSSLTSIMKAFNIQAGNMELVVDMLVKVGQEYAVSASELGEALQNGASALEAGGNTLEQSIALIAAGNAAVQDASSVGNALKTTSMRIRSSTAELEEMGETVDDIVKSASTYRKEILAMSGVDIMANSDTYKSTYEILREIADVWDELSDIQQATLLEDLAGKRNANTIKSIITNLKDLEGAYDAANNAAGTLAAANETYIQSIEAKLSKFSANFQQLSGSVIDSGLIKAVVDFGSVLVSCLTALSDISLLLPLIIASLVAYKSLKLVETTNQIAARLIAEKAATESLVVSYQSLNAAQRARVLTTLEEAVATKQLTADEYRDITAKLGLATATTGVKAATDGLNVSIKSLLASNPVGWILLAISLVPTLIGLLKNFHKSNEDLIQDAKEMKAEYNGTFTQMESEIQTLHSLETEFEKLSRGVDEYGNNISLSANEYERYQEIVETILGISSELIEGYDAEGRAIANKNGLLERSISLMEREQRLKFKEYYDDKNFKTIANGLVANVDDKLKNLDEMPSSLAHSGVETLRSIPLYIQKAIGVEYDVLRDNLVSYIQNNADLIEENIGNILNNARVSYLNGNDTWKPLAENQIDDLKDYILSITRATEQATTELNQELQDVPRALSSYYELSNAQKYFLSEYINNFRMTANTTAKDILKMKEDIQDFTDFLAGNEDLKATVDLGISLRTGKDVDGNDLSVEEYEKQVEKLIQNIGSFSDDVQVYLRTVLHIDEDSDQIDSDIAKAIQHAKNLLQDEFDANVSELSVKEVLQIYYNISADPNSLTFEELKNKLDSLAAEWNDAVSIDTILSKFDTVSGDIDKLSGALVEFKEDGVAGISTLAGLSDAFGDLPSFEAFVDTMSDSASSMEDAQQACNQLASEFVTMSGVLDAVDESNAEIVKRMLEMIGVTNANEVVQAKLGPTYLDERAAAMGLADAVWEDVEAKLSEAGASETALEALKRLRQEQYNARLAALDLTEASGSAISALIGEAKAAGVAAEQLAQLEKVKFFVERFEQAKSDPHTVISEEAEKNYYATIDRMLNRAKADLSDIGNFSLPEINVSVSENSSKNSTKKIEEYIADIDKYREAVERLRKAQENVGNLETEIDNTGSLEKRIELQKELIAAYQEEQAALHNLNNQRDATIMKESQSLRKLGFDVQYDADANELWISNLEHLNELTANSKGEYDSVQEATNALRKDTEELINTLESLNEANRENSESWTELTHDIQEANIAIYENTVKERENLITLTENWLEMATGDNDIKRIEQYSDNIVSYYRDMQETIHQEAEYYRSLGYSDTSDEVSSLSDLWWDYENDIKDVKQNVVNYLADIVTSASDMVDEIQNVFDVLKNAADEYAQNGGFISVDTFQKIIDLGPQYMQYLQDENGLLVINEERIQAVTAARAEQLALESAMTYVERLRLAMQEGSIEDLNELLYATEQTTDATWDLVKANLAMLGLDDDGYEAALHNIEALKAIAVGAIDGLGKTAGAAQGGFDSILNYVMDMLKQQTQDEIDALKDMKDAYGEIIDQRKAALDAAKKEADYEKDKASKLKDIAKIQAKIDALSLDSSREAQAERIKLEEEKAQLQESLADAQSDYAIESQKNALDEMKDAYGEEKDDEIKKLEDSISSQQKLYEKAADYITYYWKNSWDDLRTQLLQWNYDVGNSLQTEIESAWDNCTAYITNHPLGVSGLFQTSSSSSSSSGSGSNKTSNNNAVAVTNEGKINNLVTQMKANSAEWNTASDSRREVLEAENRGYAAQIGDLLGGKLTIGEDGWWYLPNGKKLYDVYKGAYHTGGFAGEIGSLKDNEIMAKLEKGEPVLTARMWDSVTAMVERFSKMSKSFADMPLPISQNLLQNRAIADKSAISSVINNNSSPIEITFGSTIINGANNDTVEKHRAITRQQTNELLDKLNIRR